jgi:plasmid stabilization system protein ParE
MTGYDFHPEAVLDLEEIWEYIAGDNLDAADRTIADILTALDKLVPSQIRAMNAPTSPRGLCGSPWYVST